MTPAQARASHRRQIDMHGETIILRRQSANKTATLSAKVSGYQPHELVGLIQQGDRKVIFMADDLDAEVAAGRWIAPLQVKDRITAHGQTMTITAIDDSTRRIAGELIAYEITARGD